MTLEQQNDGQLEFPDKMHVTLDQIKEPMAAFDKKLDLAVDRIPNYLLSREPRSKNTQTVLNRIESIRNRMPDVESLTADEEGKIPDFEFQRVCCEIRDLNNEVVNVLNGFFNSNDFDSCTRGGKKFNNPLYADFAFCDLYEGLLDTLQPLMGTLTGDLKKQGNKISKKKVGNLQMHYKNARSRLNLPEKDGLPGDIFVADVSVRDLDKDVSTVNIRRGREWDMRDARGEMNEDAAMGPVPSSARKPAEETEVVVAEPLLDVGEWEDDDITQNSNPIMVYSVAAVVGFFEKEFVEAMADIPGSDGFVDRIIGPVKDMIKRLQEDGVNHVSLLNFHTQILPIGRFLEDWMRRLPLDSPIRTKVLLLKNNFESTVVSLLNPVNIPNHLPKGDLDVDELGAPGLQMLEMPGEVSESIAGIGLAGSSYQPARANDDELPDDESEEIDLNWENGNGSSGVYFEDTISPVEIDLGLNNSDDVEEESSIIDVVTGDYVDASEEVAPKQLTMNDMGSVPAPAREAVAHMNQIIGSDVPRAFAMPDDVEVVSEEDREVPADVQVVTPVFEGDLFSKGDFDMQEYLAEMERFKAEKALKKQAPTKKPWWRKTATKVLAAAAILLPAQCIEYDPAEEVQTPQAEEIAPSSDFELPVLQPAAEDINPEVTELTKNTVEEVPVVDEQTSDLQLETGHSTIWESTGGDIETVHDVLANDFYQSEPSVLRDAISEELHNKTVYAQIRDMVAGYGYWVPPQDITTFAELNKAASSGVFSGIEVDTFLTQAGSGLLEQAEINKIIKGFNARDL